MSTYQPHRTKQFAYGTLILCLCFVPLLRIFSQGNHVSGKIIDRESGMPIDAATAYINGTSTGTTTDPSGVFQLDNVSLPSELIISHVSYELSRIDLQDASKLENLLYSMDKKVVMLEEATLIHDHPQYLSNRSSASTDHSPSCRSQMSAISLNSGFFLPSSLKSEMAVKGISKWV